MRWILLTTLTGCVRPVVLDGEGLRLEDACPVTPADVPAAQAEARHALARIACHRALMGLQTGPVDADLAAAAQAHAAYMRDNDRLGHAEEPGLPGFTGEAAIDRAAAAGFPVSGGQVFSEIVAWGQSPEAIADSWMGGPYHRQPLSLPGWQAVGYGQDGVWAALTTVTPYPAGVRSAVLYPAHGQAGVPTSWDSDTEWPDPVPEVGLTGYPVTVTLTAPDLGPDPADPYAVTVLEASLEGPDGVVETRLLEPAADPTLSSLVALVPLDILRTGTSYTVRFVLEWGGQEEVVQGTFTTGP